MTAIDRAAFQVLAGTAFTQASSGNLFANYSNNNIAGLIRNEGWDGALVLCLQKTGAGTCTVTPQGSFDGGVTFYSFGYQPTDAQATLTRATGGISVTSANPFGHVYQILDLYPFMQFAVSSISGNFSLTPYLLLSPI